VLNRTNLTKETNHDCYAYPKLSYLLNRKKERKSENIVAHPKPSKSDSRCNWVLFHNYTRENNT